MTPCMPRGSTNGILKDAIDGQAIAAIPAFDRAADWLRLTRVYGSC
jgi:hypothetical protein